MPDEVHKIEKGDETVTIRFTLEELEQLDYALGYCWEDRPWLEWLDEFAICPAIEKVKGALLEEAIKE